LAGRAVWLALKPAEAMRSAFSFPISGA
jgi:hypothetical protein